MKLWLNEVLSMICFTLKLYLKFFFTDIKLYYTPFDKNSEFFQLNYEFIFINGYSVLVFVNSNKQL